MAHKITTPHDSYFQAMMERKEVACSFFKAHLDPKVVIELDWNTLQLADSVRRNLNKKPTYTDITYLCYTMDQHILIYLHVEQERNVDPFILARIMQYNAGLFIKHKKQGYKKPPIIANFVIYNGRKRKIYPYHENSYDYFEIPWMAKLLMGRFFLPINLNEEADSSLANHKSSAMMQILLKRASDSNFITWLKENHNLMQHVPFKDILSVSIAYLLQVNAASAEEILEAFSNIYPQFKNTIMTAARQLEKKGEAKGIKLGIEQGMQRNKLTIAKNMLKKGYDIKSIQEITELTKEDIENVKKEIQKSSGK